MNDNKKKCDKERDATIDRHYRSHIYLCASHRIAAMLQCAAQPARALGVSLRHAQTRALDFAPRLGVGRRHIVGKVVVVVVVVGGGIIVDAALCRALLLALLLLFQVTSVLA